MEFPPIVSNVSVAPASGPGGTVFTASVAASDFPPIRIAYQWRLDGADIPGATGSSYIATVAGDLTVVATVTNGNGSDSRESLAAAVTRSLAVPEITQARIEPKNGVIGARFGVIAEATGIPVPDLSCQWFLDGAPIPGATAMTYTATGSGRLSARVTGRNSVGSHSRDTDAVDLPAESEAPTLIGVTVSPNGGRVGDVFTVAAQAAGSPAPELGYQWLLDGLAIAGATGASHVAAGAGNLSVRATATNPAGSDSRESTAVSVAPGLTPPVVDAVDILPDAGRVGDTFTAVALVSGDPEPELRFEWILDGQPIAGAAGHAYTAGEAGMLQVRAIATSSEGEAIGESAAIRVDPALAAPKLAGATIVPASGRIGDTFEVVASASGNPTPELRFQWFLDGAAIVGATGTSLTAAAEGRLSVRVTATNSAGSDSLEADAVVRAIGAPIADGGAHVWNERAGSGLRTYDAGTRFSVPGDPEKATVVYELLSGGRGGPFEEGVLEEGVYLPVGGGYVSIDAAEGVLSIDTNTSGPQAGVAITVRASNGAGHDDLTITLNVSAADQDERVSDVQIIGTGACWTEHGISFRLDGALIETAADLPAGVSVGVRWRRDGVPIEGARDWTYVPVAVDDAKRLSVAITLDGVSGEAVSGERLINNPELIVNGTFDGNGAPWIPQNPDVVIVDGVARKDATGQQFAAALRQNFGGFVAGAQYETKYTLVALGAGSGSSLIRFLGGSSVNGSGRTSAGTYVQTLTAAPGNDRVVFDCHTSRTFVLDNVSMKRIA